MSTRRIKTKERLRMFFEQFADAHDINTEILRFEPGKYALVKATINAGPFSSTGHALRYHADEPGVNDTTFIGAAETAAVARALAFIFDDGSDEVHSMEDFALAMADKYATIDKMAKSSLSMARAYISAEIDDDVREILLEYLDSISVVSDEKIPAKQAATDYWTKPTKE